MLIEGWSSIWPTAWRFGNKTGILPHYHIPWKDTRHQKRRGKVGAKVMEGYKTILLYKSGPMKQAT